MIIAVAALSLASAHGTVAAVAAAARVAIARVQRAPLVAGGSFAAGFAVGRISSDAFVQYQTASDVPGR